MDTDERWFLIQVMKRNIVLFCFVFASLVFFTDICQAHNPQRIAVLPVMNQSYMHDAEVEKVISDSLYANFHVPLAKILNRDCEPDCEPMFNYMQE